MAALEIGATANLLRFSWLARHNRILERRGVRRVTTYPSWARFRFGGWRLGAVRHAADIPVGIAGNKGMFTAFALGEEGVFQRCCERAPWRLLADSWILRAVR